MFTSTAMAALLLIAQGESGTTSHSEVESSTFVPEDLPLIPAFAVLAFGGHCVGCGCSTAVSVLAGPLGLLLWPAGAITTAAAVVMGALQLMSSMGTEKQIGSAAVTGAILAEAAYVTLAGAIALYFIAAADSSTGLPNLFPGVFSYVSAILYGVPIAFAIAAPVFAAISMFAYGENKEQLRGEPVSEVPGVQLR